MAGPAKGSIHVEGLRDLGERMKALSFDINSRGSRAATRAAARVIQEAAKKNAAPMRDTGNLERSIMTRMIPKGKTRYTAEAHVAVRTGKVSRKERAAARKKGVAARVDAYYWRFVEFGTVKMAARPFMRPALEANRQAAIDAMVAQLLKAIARGEKRQGQAPRLTTLARREGAGQ